MRIGQLDEYHWFGKSARGQPWLCRKDVRAFSHHFKMLLTAVCNCRSIKRMSEVDLVEGSEVLSRPQVDLVKGSEMLSAKVDLVKKDREMLSPTGGSGR
ncbi:hypothetical protein TNCV_4042401 [Trichonephila clavipes]|nr:hypothetical protein TNCV_4042401 [Trichonephila clavipes]